MDVLLAFTVSTYGIASGQELARSLMADHLKNMRRSDGALFGITHRDWYERGVRHRQLGVPDIHTYCVFWL